MLYSASGQSDTMLMTQIRNLGVAFFVLLVTAQLKVATLKGVSPYIFSITVVLLIGVAFFGVGAKGAQRWLDLGFIRFQPSEVMKVAMPLAVAWWLSKKALAPARRELLIAFLMVALPSLLILGQPDLGTSLLVAISGLSVIFMAGIQWRYIFVDVVFDRPVDLARVAVRLEGLSKAARADPCLTRSPIDWVPDGILFNLKRRLVLEDGKG